MAIGAGEELYGKPLLLQRTTWKPSRIIHLYLITSLGMTSRINCRRASLCPAGESDLGLCQLATSDSFISHFLHAQHHHYHNDQQNLLTLATLISSSIPSVPGLELLPMADAAASLKSPKPPPKPPRRPKSTEGRQVHFDAGSKTDAADAAGTESKFVNSTQFPQVGPAPSGQIQWHISANPTRSVNAPGQVFANPGHLTAAPPQNPFPPSNNPLPGITSLPHTNANPNPNPTTFIGVPPQQPLQVAMAADYQNAAPPNQGLHFQPPVPTRPLVP